MLGLLFCVWFGHESHTYFFHVIAYKQTVLVGQTVFAKKNRSTIMQTAYFWKVSGTTMCPTAKAMKSDSRQFHQANVVHV